MVIFTFINTFQTNLKIKFKNAVKIPKLIFNEIRHGIHLEKYKNS